MPGPTLFQRIAAVVLFACAWMPLSSSGAGFFDRVPQKGYIRDDISLEVLSATDQQRSVIATVRYVKLVLDPGRRDVQADFWPEREMLMVARATGELVIFERLLKLPAREDAQEFIPRARIGLEGGIAIESFSRAAGGAAAPASPGVPSSCATLDALVRSGNLEVPYATADLGVPTVRLGIAQVVENSVGARERELIAATIPILLLAQAQGIPVGPLESLNLLFPGRAFAKSTEALAFRISAAAPLNPAEGAWRSVTAAPEMVAGVPLF